MNDQLSKLAGDIFSSVTGYVARALEPIAKRLLDLEAREPAAGRDGRDGKDASPEDMAIAAGAALAAAIESLPAPKDGAPGEPGEAGKSVAPEEVERMVHRAVAEMPTPANGVDGIDGAPGQKGLDGRDGKDGDPGRDAAFIEPLSAIDPERGYARGTWAKHAGGLWLARTLTDGMEGWDCIVNGVASLDVTSDGLRTVGVTAALSDGQTKAATFELPTMVYRGAWAAGKDYTPGDTSSWEGSMWHCEAPTTDRPGTSPAWRLCVKHGRDGKDGLRGQKGERGGEGRAGHDLTQMDFNGRRT